MLSSGYSWYDRAHNVLIDLGFSAGILGLLAYLFLWICLIGRLRTTNSLLSSLDRRILGALFMAYFFFNLFNFDSLLPLQLIFLLLAFIDISPVSTASVSPSPNSFWVPVSQGVATLLITGLAIYSVYQPYRTLRALDRQNKLADIQERTRALETIYQEATGRQLDMADNMVSLALSVLQSNQPESAKQLCYQRATALMNEQLAKHPRYTRLMTRLVALYIAGREFDKAVTLCQQMNTVEGSIRPPAFIQLGNAYINKGAYSQALVAFEQARQLYPRWEEPMLYKALTFAIQRDTSQCYQLLRTISTQTLTSRLLFVKQIYGQAGAPQQFPRRLEHTENKEPYTPDVYVEWALSAFDLNDTYQMTTAINSFYNMYFRNQRDYQEFKELIDKGKRGIRPDRLAELARNLAQ
ncbi:tetratricopeptide repeat protein [Spirosoma telluris]|uniref:tetratricopeptide repeat protein n=1 Tax=Spirosoma telluris TaxID=2183553 RepID=UPI002FC2F724